MTPFNLRRILLSVLLRLPSALLRFASGGGIVHIEGRTLDVQIQYLWLGWIKSIDLPSLSFKDRPLSEVRQAWVATADYLKPFKPLKVRTQSVASSDDGVGGILIRPIKLDQDTPLLVFFHDGGGVLGGPELSLSFASLLSEALGAIIYLPAYRLAPENRFPAALDDAHKSFDWALGHAQELGVTLGKVSVGGQMIGAALAASLCLDRLQAGKSLPCAQLLISPWVQLADETLGQSPYAPMWPLAYEDLDLILKTYVGADSDWRDPRLSPFEALGEAHAVKGLPKALIVNGGLDLLAGQGQAYALKLMAADTQVIYRRYDNLPLGFGLFCGVVETARLACVDIAKHYQALLHQQPSSVPTA
jgi:acetyl esterase